jgi:acetolactate synthase-1/2/3 large subunit
MGKGAVDYTADYSLYTIGLGQWDHVAEAARQSDLIITVGYDVVEYPPRLWNPEGRETIVHIDFDPAELDHEYHPEVELIGDVGNSLRRLTECFVEQGGAPAYDFSAQRAARDRMRADIERYADDDTEGPMRPQKAVWDARQMLGPSDILLCGVGAHKMWVGRHYHCHEPNTCLIPNGFCSMGMPLPGAIGASLVADGRRILGLAGDGDFLMNVQEMETARRLNADITLLVWEDGEYGLIAWKQDDEYGHHTDLSFANPDWAQLAAAFGWHYRYVDRSRELQSVLTEALDTPGPSLVVIPVDYRENQLLSQQLGMFTGE